MENLYNSQFVKQLFDEMAATYGWVNLISSFGFCQRWRKQCVRQVTIKPGMVVFDLMTGMGECWHLVNYDLRNIGAVVALDLSSAMCRRGGLQRRFLPSLDLSIVQQDILYNGLAANSADCIISSFGLKTFSLEQQHILATEVQRLLKPGGVASFVEISVPPSLLLRLPYLFYLQYCIPLIGKLFLGNPDNYRLLGIYTEKFGDCSAFATALAHCGLQVTRCSFFFGCATGIYAVKSREERLGYTE
ncbi:MAG: class I SAM-dependent methyltransferase [Caldilineaceae bacterium]